MLVKYPITVVFLLVAATISKSQRADSVNISTGALFVKGKTFNKQIFFQKGAELIQITRFKKWEEIKEISVSPDEKDLLIYHKSDKDPSHKLSILNLSSFQIAKTVKPGYGGDLYWTRDSNILLKWGCGSPCQCFRLYDSNLKEVEQKCEGVFQVFVAENVIVSLPAMFTKEGIFKVWSLSDGRLISESSFRDKYGDYYCWDTKMLDGRLMVNLVLYKEGDPVVLEYLNINAN